MVPQGHTSLLAGAGAQDVPPPPSPPAGGRQCPPAESSDLGRGDAAGGDAEVGEARSSASPPAGARKADARWLGFLLFQSLALLAFQAVTVLKSGSVALTAELGHSSADVVGYLVNYVMELWKVSSAARAADESRNSWSDRLVAVAGRNADILGCGISMILLACATGEAFQEAMARLMPSEEHGDHHGCCGHHHHHHPIPTGRFMLTFSVVTTLTQVVTLVAYKRCFVAAEARATSGEASAQQSARTVAVELAGCRAPEAPETAADAAASLPSQPPAPPVPTITRLPKKKWSATRLDEHGICVRPDCKDECGSRTTSSGDAVAWLHTLVHPGCDGHHRDAGALGGGNTNLNVVAALLHLVSDILRNLTILAVALLMEAGVLEDHERTDALCGLAVAVLVALGSVATFARLYHAIRRRLSSRRDTGPAVSA